MEPKRHVDSGAERGSDKAAELAGIAALACSRIGEPLGEATVRTLVEHYATITPPERQVLSHWVTMNMGGRGGGTSVKPGNVRLNMQHLVTAIASGVLTIVGVLQAPWTAVFGALVIWDTLYTGARVELSESDASVLWTLWLLRDDDNTVADTGLLKKVNTERSKYGRRSLTSDELDESLRRLTRLRSIERANDKSRWWLRERVCVSYE